MTGGQYKQGTKEWYSRGFTVVELLIVIVIIGLLASVSTVTYKGMQDRARQAAVQTEHSKLAERIESYTGTDNYPASISSCPTPASGHLCIQPRAGQTLRYYAFNPTSPGRFFHGLHSRVDPAYELEIRNSDGFYYASNAEIYKDPALTGREFVQYMDMAPLINQYGLRKYKISFDIKSASIASANTAQVYLQNGSGARYTFYAGVPVTTSYVRQTVTVTPTGPNAGFTEAVLAFYGTYNTGNWLTIKNVVIQEG